MKSIFAKDVDPDQPWPEYPRPRLVRDNWLNLNGPWDYAIAPARKSGEPNLKGTFADAAASDKLTPGDAPEKWDGKILVPFCAESQLSGVRRRVSENERLWYKRAIKIPSDWKGQRILLHFGAVDWDSTIWLNGQRVGHHTGGNDPFTIELTNQVKWDGPNELLISVWDPTDTMSQPRGKQVKQPRGIWYTPVTGIWQTVWLEPVPAAAIADVKILPDLDRNQFIVTVSESLNPDSNEKKSDRSKVKVTLLDGEQEVATAEGRVDEELKLSIKSPKLWSPDQPFLYGVKAELTSGDVRDAVASYAGLRKIDFRKDERGHQRMYLNNEPVFQYGPLDQGWWPDGLLTPPNEAGLKYDIEVTKKLGFNMARKHIKIEPQRWYYWCDKLGLLVWQDMPSGMVKEEQQVHRGGKEDIKFTKDQTEQFRDELKRMIDALYSHPCIVVWVPFNEGWGQHDTNEILKWTKKYDPSRLTNGPSGWEDRGWGDMIDMHQYPGPGMFPAPKDRVSVLGEFGGLGLPLEGHTWLGKDNWGYRTYTTTEELRSQYDKLIVQMPPLIADGLAAAVYTQTTDVEVEVNGLMTYDRAVIKFDADHLAKLHQQLYAPPGVRTVILPTARTEPQEWKYTTTQPAEGWNKADFKPGDDWKTGRGGFGTRMTPNSVINTVWNTEDIWIHKEFNVDKTPEGQLILKIFHDDDAEVYLNGELLHQVKGFERGYNSVPVSLPLQAGKNVITAHCKQVRGGQCIDIGLETFQSGEKK